jgi:hypothetical protein
VNWLEHNSFTSEFKTLAKKHRTLEADYPMAKKLLEAQFDPAEKSNPIDPGKIHRLSKLGEERYLWKFEVFVRGLKPGQWPRMWFAVVDDIIMPLVLLSHSQKYDNNATDNLAFKRYQELFEQI